MMIYECKKCGHEVGTFISVLDVFCTKCQKSMKGRVVDTEEMKRAFPEPKRRRSSRGTRK